MPLNQPLVILFVLATIGVTGCTTQDKSTDAQTKSLAVQGGATVKSSSDAAILFAETEVDMGKTAADQKQVAGELHFRNVGGKTLRIEKVSGTCPCFLSWSGDSVVMPGRDGTIRVVFRTGTMSPGISVHNVNIETNDNANKTVRVGFKSNVEPDMAKELSAMRNDIRALRSDMNKLLDAMGIEHTDKASVAATPAASAKKYDIAIGSSPVLGPAGAPVTIVEFIDFQCPYCVKEHPKIKQIEDEYPDKVKVVFKHYPLDFHKQAKPAHAAAELAKLQGGPNQFWKMYALIMAAPTKLDIDTLRKYTRSLNLDTAKFDEAIADPNKINDLLRADLAEAKKCDVHGTPTVFVNGLQLSDRSIEGYKTRINNILAGNLGK
jgi:protein-disulfide isomerase